MSGATPLTIRKRQLVRAELAQVAVGLFAQHGFEEVTVDDIADAAGVSPRTFFRYFSTKDEIVLEFEQRLYERLLAAFDARPSEEGPVAALHNAYAATSEVAPAERPRVLEIGRILGAAPTLQVLSYGRRGAEAGSLVARVAARMGVDPEVDPRPRVVVAAMAAVASAEWHAWVTAGGEGDPAARIVAALSLVERGLDVLDRRQGTTATRKG